MSTNKYRIDVDRRMFPSLADPPLALEGASFEACRNWIENSAPGIRLLYTIVPADYPDRKRREEIRETVTKAINSMGSHFFTVSVTFQNEEEAKYAERLWTGRAPTRRDKCEVFFHA